MILNLLLNLIDIGSIHNYCLRLCGAGIGRVFVLDDDYSDRVHDDNVSKMKPRYSFSIRGPTGGL